MDPMSIAIAVALAQGLVQVGSKLIDKGIVEPALEPAAERLKKLVQRGYRRAEQDQALVADLLEAGGAEVRLPGNYWLTYLSVNNFVFLSAIVPLWSVVGCVSGRIAE